MKKESKLPLYLIILITFIGFSFLIALMIVDATNRVQNGSLKLAYKHYDEHPQNEPVFIYLEANSEYGIKKIELHYPQGENLSSPIPFTLHKGSSFFTALLPGKEKGQRSYFYIYAEDNAGNEVYLPEEAGKTGGKWFVIKFEGRASFFLKLLHIMFMLTSLTIFIHAFYYAVSYLKNENEKADLRLGALLLWGIIVFFITGFPIGWMIGWQVTGQAWTGIPFGWDITDNKTLLILIYWLAVLIPFKLNKFSVRTLAKLIILGTIFTLVLFLVPHSI
ncbi:MAG: hypothetical protein ACE5WD_04055 [Candidatus Aminicenantia bacterium]